MVAEALLYTPVQVLPNHHARLATVVADRGPQLDGRFLFSSYMFLEEQPPEWFWRYTGVIRALRGKVSEIELLRAQARCIEIKRMPAVPECFSQFGVPVRDADGNVVLFAELFGRKVAVKIHEEK